LLYQRRGVCQRGEYAHLYLRRRDLGLAITVTQTGIGGVVGNALLQLCRWIKSPFTSFLALTGITSALNFIMTANGVPALYTTWRRASPTPPASRC
jgi:hypothetical protein